MDSFYFSRKYLNDILKSPHAKGYFIPSPPLKKNFRLRRDISCDRNQTPSYSAGIQTPLATPQDLSSIKRVNLITRNGSERLIRRRRDDCYTSMSRCERSNRSIQSRRSIIIPSVFPKLL